MHPRLEELLGHIDRNHRAFLAEVERIPVPLRAVRPEPTRWSVAEVTDHLAIVTSRVAKMLGHRAAVARTDGLGPDPDHSPVVGTIDVARIIARTDILVAPSSVVPSAAADATLAEEELAEAHRRLRDAVVASDGVDLSQITLAHPALGDLNFYQWLSFIGAHESRHAQQVAEIGEALRSRV